MSNENVVYDSAEAASQAFEEIRTAVAHCPRDQFVSAKVGGLPPTKFEIAPIPDDQIGQVSPAHVAVGGKLIFQTGGQMTLAAVYQRRGRVMAALYGPDLAAIRPYVPVVASRLATLSQAEAGE
jgi:hypothetical protein